MNRPPELESPPALGAGGQAIAVGALAEPHYADARKAGKPDDWQGPCVNVPRAIIEQTVAALIDVLDRSDGQGDFEDDDPAEHNGDDLGDTAWVEWQSTPANRRRQGQPGIIAGQEDDEDDDPKENDDADSAVDDWPCDDIDMDREPENGL